MKKKCLKLRNEAKKFCSLKSGPRLPSLVFVLLLLLLLFFFGAAGSRACVRWTRLLVFFWEYRRRGAVNRARRRVLCALN